MVPVSLDCPFLIATSVFSNVCLHFDDRNSSSHCHSHLSDHFIEERLDNNVDINLDVCCIFVLTILVAMHLNLTTTLGVM
jgi:hypothetical protein